MNNLAALGVGLLVPVTVIGDDGHGYDLLREVRRLPVDPGYILPASDRLTPTYTKPMRPVAASDSVGNALRGVPLTWEELNRLDIRTREPLSAAATAEVCRRVEQVFHSSDGLIVLDQLVDENCGVVNAQVRDTLARLARENPAKLIYADSRRFLGRFAAATLKGNRSEVLRACNEANTDDQAVARSLAALSPRTGRPAFCTVGQRGILVARPGHEPTVIPGCPVSGPIDIVGAGDAATSGIVSALLAGASEVEAAALGNLVASITVQQLGTTGIASPRAGAPAVAGYKQLATAGKLAYNIGDLATSILVHRLRLMAIAFTSPLPLTAADNGIALVPIVRRVPTAFPHRLSVVQVEEMIRTGILTEYDHCELIRGELIEKMTIGDPHMAAVKRLNRFFNRVGDDRVLVGVQDAIKLRDSRPEPDISLVTPVADCYETHTPTPPDILLLIEVADSTLEFDREVKLPLYAENGIREYWIVNLVEQCLEVHRQPQAGGSYGESRIVRRGESVSPQALSDVVLLADDVLGPLAAAH